MAKYIIFDTETTGSEKEDRIIQIGAMVVDDKGRVECYDELCKADMPISIDAMSVHGITPQMIEEKSSFENTLFSKVIYSLNLPDNYLIAHNLPFDLQMLEREGFVNQMQLIDTLRCSRHLLKDSTKHSLQYLRYYLELYKKEQKEADKYNITIKAHDAIGDVLILKLLLNHLATLLKEQENLDLDGIMKRLTELTKTPVIVDVFKFGKYKDRKISEVIEEDKGYINWMIDKMDLDEDMQYTLQYWMKK